MVGIPYFASVQGIDMGFGPAPDALLGQKSIPPVALDATLVRGRSMDPVMDPMYGGSGGSDFVAIAVVAVFVLFVLLGLMLIHRITRDPDETPDHWRSHRH